MTLEQTDAMKRCFDVRTSSGWRYPVLAGGAVPAALDQLWQSDWHHLVVIGDSHTLPLFGQPIVERLAHRVTQSLCLQFEAGDQHKTRETKARLEDEMLAKHLDRSTCIVAVGGGVALDLAGFIAATFLRGVAHMNVATSLLAQVDAAIGGKTGVNTALGKNLIGAFYPPRAVLIDTDALAHLPLSELRCGFAECIKHAVIADAQLFADFEQLLRSDGLMPSTEMIVRAAQIKANVVADDEYEQGRRATLNFGHTIAHAIEAATDHQTPHGEAVAVGMIIEAQLAENLALAQPGLCRRLGALIRAAGLPTQPGCEYSEAAPFLQSDKKNRRGILHFALPAAIGQMAGGKQGWTHPVDASQVALAWQQVLA